MQNDLIKITLDKWRPADDAGVLCRAAAELADELKGVRPPRKNQSAWLLYVLRTVGKAEVSSSARPIRLTWRERITGRVQA